MGGSSPRSSRGTEEIEQFDETNASYEESSDRNEPRSNIGTCDDDSDDDAILLSRPPLRSAKSFLVRVQNASALTGMVHFENSQPSSMLMSQAFVLLRLTRSTNPVIQTMLRKRHRRRFRCSCVTLMLLCPLDQFFRVE